MSNSGKARAMPSQAVAVHGSLEKKCVQQMQQASTRLSLQLRYKCKYVQMTNTGLDSCFITRFMNHFGWPTNLESQVLSNGRANLSRRSCTLGSNPTTSTIDAPIHFLTSRTPKFECWNKWCFNGMEVSLFCSAVFSANTAMASVQTSQEANEHSVPSSLICGSRPIPKITNLKPGLIKETKVYNHVRKQKN